jgi:cellulose synthase operon protein C
MGENFARGEDMHEDLLTRARRLERYALQDPANWQLRLDLAQTYHRAGLHQSALEVLDRPAAAQPPQEVTSLRGQLLLAMGRWSEAIALFEAAQAQHPESAAIAFNLAYGVWASETDPERAVSLFRRALELDANQIAAYRHLGLALEATGNLPAARQALEEALERAPTDGPTLLQLGRLLLDTGDFAGASAIAARGVAAAPAWAEAWAFKGQVALFELDAAAAARSLRQALDLDPAAVDTPVLLAQATLMQGRVRPARALLEAVVSEHTTDSGALCMLGWACLYDEDVAGADSAFERAASAEAGNAEAWSGRAVVALARGREADAEGAAGKALQMEPEHVIARLIMRRLHELDGRADEAKKVIDAVLASAPFGPFNTSTAGLLQSPGVQRLLRRQQRRMASAAARAASTSMPPHS